MRLYRIGSAPIVEHEGQSYTLHDTNFDQLLARDDLFEYLRGATTAMPVGPQIPAKRNAHLDILRLHEEAQRRNPN